MKKINLYFFRALQLCLAFISFSLASCSDAGDIVEIALDPPKRKPIDLTKLGTNNFFNVPQFGTNAQQYSNMQQLKVKHVRILIAWLDGTQPTPTSPIDYSFYDNIINSAPAGIDILPVVVHVPTWMTNPSNWQNGDPKATFVNKWLVPLVQRYKNNPRVVGWEIWNEPNASVLDQDRVMGFDSNPSNYVALLAQARSAIKSIDPSKLVVMAATTSLNQNYPNTLNYNKEMLNLGVAALTDVYNIHYYGTNYDKVIVRDGIADTVNGAGKPVWVTESGEQGVSKQLAYAETTWPFLAEKIPAIQRIYQYQYGETQPPESTYGLRNTSTTAPVSDLYNYLISAQ